MQRPLSINENSERRYMHGWINRIIRWYFYFQEGLSQMSNLRSIAYGLIGIAGILAISTTTKTQIHGFFDLVRIYWQLFALGIAVIPVLAFIGFLWVTRGKKSTEYFTIRYTSTFGRYGIEMSERQIELLESINEKLDKLLTQNPGGFLNE